VEAIKALGKIVAQKTLGGEEKALELLFKDIGESIQSNFTSISFLKTGYYVQTKCC